MNSINRKLVLTQVVTHIIILLIIVVLSIVFAPANFEVSFVSNWYVSNSIIYYLQYIIPIIATGLLITFSTQLRPEDMGGGKSFFKMIQGSLVFLLVIMLVYTLLLMLLLPWAYQKRADAQYRSDYIYGLIEDTQNLMNDGEYKDADDKIGDVLNLVPNHRKARELFQEIQRDLPPTRVTPAPETVPPSLPMDLSYGDILDLAKKYYEDENWYSAVFYARLALGPDENRSEPEARHILSESLKKISGLEPTAEEMLQRQLFELKQQAVKAYNAGQYVNSYYLFKDLEKQNPDDPDLETYMTYLAPRVATVSFFLDEIDGANHQSMRRNVFFRVPSLSDAGSDMSSVGSGESTDSSSDAGDGTLRFIAAEQMMNSPRGLYFINMEYIEVDPMGIVTKNIFVPNGKMSGNYLITRAIDRNDISRYTEAIYRKGQPTAMEEGVLKVAMNPGEIWAVNPSTPFYNDVNILQLFSLSKMYPRFGKNSLFPQSEILYRLLLPFSLINISLMIIGMAWRGRSRYLDGPPVYLFVFFPIIPLFILGLYELYIHVFRNLLSAVLILAGFPVALLVLFGIQALVFILIMLMLARLSTE